MRGRAPIPHNVPGRNAICRGANMSARCTNCERRLPAEAFPPNRHAKSGLSSWCRQCHNAASRRSRAGIRATPVELTCTECGTTFLGRRGRLVCSRKCTDARYRRLHPDAYREKRKRIDARRRARARGEE